MTETDPLFPGQQVRVKATPDNRRYGVSTVGAWAAKGDDRAFPGDVATVVKSLYTAHDGSPMAHWYLEFSRGRIISLNVPDDVSYVDAEYAIFSRYPEDFLRHRTPKNNA